MALASGTRLGSYEIVAPLGAGGMGEVYRAKDTKLNRDVAIKVLPESFALDADRVARFTREAQVLASLNHSNIAAIYGIEESEVRGSTSGVRALVMELVEGEDLSSVIVRGPEGPHQRSGLPLADALPIAKQIAEALEAAHEQGIVHRDLKPQNIKVRADGTVKVLDFGLAKAMDRTLDPGPNSGPGTRDSANSPTMTSPAMTGMGMILGTAAYMSPEQAKGRSVDKRSDIWAFGVVLYEMLTGRRAFEGDDVSDLLVAVLSKDVDLGALPAETPAAMVSLIQRCLVRDPKNRLRDIGEARVMLGAPVAAAETRVVMPAPAPSRRSRMWWSLATVAIAAITGALVWRMRTPPPAPEERLVILSPTPAPPQIAMISPDATTVAIVAGDRVWLRRLNDFTATELPGTEGARAVFWSPDSATLGFQARGQLWRVAAHGGAPTPIAEVPDLTLAGGAAWTSNDSLIYATGSSPLMTLNLNSGGPAQTLFPLDPQKDIDVHDPSLLPGNAGVLFQIHAAPGVTEGLQAFSASSGRRMLLKTTGRATTPVYSPTGHLLYELNASVWASAFSLATQTVSGEPILIAESARRPSVAADGTIVMLSGTASTAVSLTVVDASGKAGQTIGTRKPVLPRVSPDKQMVAAAVGFGPQLDIWIFDLARHTERRLTFEPTADTKPSWSPDGKFVVYTCGTAICARRSDGSGSAVELVKNAIEGEVTPDGKSLVFTRNDVESGIFTLALDHGLDATPTAAPKLAIRLSQALHIDVSPDGRFVAFVSRESGIDAVYVTRFPSGEGRWEIPVKMGTQPRWSPKGDRLFLFDELARIVEVPVDLKTTFSAGAPQVRMPVAGALRANGYDLMPDGTSFLVPLPLSATDSQTRILVIKNWRPK